MGLRFAFDLGTNSIGAAVWRTGPDPNAVYGQDAPLELLWSGVRIFKDGRNPKDQQSLAAMRRIPKQARKRRDRFVLRRSDLLKALIESGLMPGEEIKREKLAACDPYELRAKALDQSLSPQEVGRILFHLNQRRGFKSNRKIDKKDKEKGKIAEASNRLRETLREMNCRTFGEFLWTRQRGKFNDPRRVRDPKRQSTRIRLEGEGAKALYAFYPTRDMISDEFNAIWRAQASYHPEIFTDELRDKLASVLFRQRDLKPPKIGRCTFIPSEERAPKALPSVEARELYERLSHLRVSIGPVEDRPLTPEERNLLAQILLTESKLTFVKIRKLLKLNGAVRINFEEAGEKELKGCLTGKLLSQETHYGKAWIKLSWSQKDEFVDKIIEASDESALIARLMKEHRLSADAAQNCATIPFADGYSRLGKTANAAILDALINERDDNGYVITYAEAVKRAGQKLGLGWHHSDERDGEIFERLPYYGQVLQRHILPGSMDPKDRGDEAAFWGRIMNPTVHIGLNQLRRIVNKMIDRFGPPDQIVVELARELKQSAAEKEKENARNRANRDANQKRAAKLGELGITDSGDARARLKLFEEQQTAGNGVALCPFSGRPIGVEQLFTSDIEIEHILPRSRTLDDSAANKVLCFRDMNRIKRGKSPFEAFGHTPDWQALVDRAEKLPPNKRWRFKPDAMEIFEQKGGFLARQLNETKYLSRIAKAYLGKVCDPDQVYVTSGALTAMLRGKWGLNSLLSDDNRKNRTDHRHHAIDAIVIGAMTRGLLQKMAYDATLAEKSDGDATIGKIPTPFDSFREAVRSSLEKIVVSYKPEHGKSGALHDDTAYGLVRNSAEAKLIGNLVYRKPVLDLKPNDIEHVRDAGLRKILHNLTEAMRNPKGKITDEKALQAVLAKFVSRSQSEGRIIRRIRIGKENASAVPISNRQSGEPYKALLPGENHHIDIVQMSNGSWKGFAETYFEVNQKGWRPKWEIQKLGGKLVMRLHKGDMVELIDKDGVRRVKTVIRLSPSNGILYLVPNHEGGDYPKRDKDKDDPFQWDYASISGLKDRECAHVLVDELGQVTRRPSNVER